MSLPLFGEKDEPPPLAARLAPRLRSLADGGIYLGTSSWKYPGWIGQIYTPERYRVRGRFSKKKFDSECLREYAATFPLVGGDFSFYQFPTADSWRRLFAEAPGSLRFALKVPEDITVTTWPTHDRYGARAGQPNECFLDAGLFAHSFAGLLEPYRDRVAVLMFEFGAFGRATFAKGPSFPERLGTFLAELPAGFRYAVEIRNPELLGRQYFSVLANHGVAHLFNAWTRMPPLDKQIAMPDAFTADFTVVRALLRRGRTYEKAVKLFRPYRSVQQSDPATRAAIRRIIERALERKEDAFLIVNNRIEGNAPGTIEAIVTEGTE